MTRSYHRTAPVLPSTPRRGSLNDLLHILEPAQSLWLECTDRHAAVVFARRIKIAALRAPDIMKGRKYTTAVHLAVPSAGLEPLAYLLKVTRQI